MKFGNKKMHRYSLGIRAGAHAVGKFGAKASHIAGYAAPVALALGQPEVAATLEAASSVAATSGFPIAKATGAAYPAI